MKVLSLYDGMACGLLALIKAEIETESYDAFEIDKYAIQTANHNFPMIKQHGDVFNADFTKFKGVDLLCGGSPCTYWSIAQKNNRETEASGMGWELFSQYVRAVKEAEPKFFVYENNKSMSAAIRESIDKAFGFEAVLINSALVSAQNRQRLYWVGKRNEDGTYSKVDIEQPEDKGILLKDILETGMDLTGNEKGYTLTASYNGAVAWNTIERSQRNMVAEPVSVRCRGRDGFAKWEARTDGKNGVITANTIGINVAEPIRVGTMPQLNGALKDNQAKRIYGIDGKSVTQSAQGGGWGAKTGLYAVPVNNVASFLPPHGWNEGLFTYEKFPNLTTGSSIRQQNVIVEPMSEENRHIAEKSQAFCNKIYEVKDGIITIKGKQYPIKLKDGFYIIRKLTVRECMRLQTVPEWYEFPVSNSQAYKMLGNGWTVDVIAHIFTYLKK